MRVAGTSFVEIAHIDYLGADVNTGTVLSFAVRPVEYQRTFPGQVTTRTRCNMRLR